MPILASLLEMAAPTRRLVKGTASKFRLYSSLILRFGSNDASDAFNTMNDIGKIV